MTNDLDHATVLIVEDERDLADLYALSLVSTCTVLIANDGTEALDRMNADVDIVLLDRRMPGRFGEEVLEVIRTEGYDCRIAMVTAVTPDVEILEMEIDDYLTKPVDRTELTETVTRLQELSAHDERVQEYYQLVTKMEALTDENAAVDVTANGEVKQLTERLTELETELEVEQEAVSEPLFRHLLDRRRGRSNDS